VAAAIAPAPAQHAPTGRSAVNAGDGYSATADELDELDDEHCQGSCYRGDEGCVHCDCCCGCTPCTYDKLRAEEVE